MADLVCCVNCNQMRRAPILLLFGLMQVSLAQTVPSSVFKSSVPDVSIHIHKHSTGADMVEITARAEGYPADLLLQQIQKLGEYLHSQPRGIDVGQYNPDPGNPSLAFTKGEFAIDGIIDRREGTLRINPIVQSFAGAPKPWTIHGVEILFQGELTTSKMPRHWNSQVVPGEGRFEGLSDSRLTGVEYRITLLSQDPSKFDIPEPWQKPTQESQKKVQASAMDLTSIIVFIVAAVAVGALVYCLLLRVKPKVSK